MVRTSVEFTITRNSEVLEGRVIEMFNINIKFKSRYSYYKDNTFTSSDVSGCKE